MKQFFGKLPFILAAIVAIAPSRILASDPTETIRDISGCLAKAPAKGKFCKKVDTFLKKNNARAEAGTQILDHEWRLRRELKQKGFDLPIEIIPVAYVWQAAGDQDLVVVADWSYGQQVGVPSKRQQAEWISYKSELVAPGTYWDGGSFNRLHFYIRPSPRKALELAYSELVTGEPVLVSKKLNLSSREIDNSLEAWFKDSDSRECANAELKSPSVVICLTHYWSKIWPEVHVWEDERGSTGIVLNTYVHVKGGYKKINGDYGYFTTAQVGAEKTHVFAAPPRGEGYNEDWSYAGPEAVMAWNPTTESLERSDELSAMYFPVTDRKIGEISGAPTKEGKFLDKKGQLFRFSK
jgi:hypothetical protein